MSIAVLIGVCIASWLIGGIPFGYMIARRVIGDDIRRHGSGNVGATNVARVVGWKWGGLVLFFDCLKGLLPTLLAGILAEEMGLDDQVGNFRVAAGIAAVFGHIYPIYLRLRGGKGVATAFGVVIVIGPKAVIAALAAFLLVAFTIRIISLASMMAAFAFTTTYFILHGGTAFETANLSSTIFAVLVTVLIVWRHRSNIGRMMNGTEPVFSKPKRPIESGPRAGAPAAKADVAMSSVDSDDGSEAQGDRHAPRF